MLEYWILVRVYELVALYTCSTHQFHSRRYNTEYCLLRGTYFQIRLYEARLAFTQLTERVFRAKGAANF
jgi:hypothetical protein